ncbi:glycerophosphodiester phosphodiesterase [Sphingomonas taxi]|uniref:glycerophosphodiester phosphodiesterase n=2 Tax=Sphingomonas taxi TaxID=1549858 RepID=A0A097EKW0_9SPHN|nr:glycerophosphodiester phosphodiesterase [Sphingomonas taxi]
MVSGLRIALTAVLLASAPANGQDRPMPKPFPTPIVIAHRGASGSRPEHTLAAYELAIDQGADFIEPDLVPTKDDVLVARHENAIAETTDVASHPEFADRRTTKTIDGQTITGWFVEDFTLAELKTLRARERLPQLRAGNAAYDGRFEIPTLAEIIDLAKRRTRETGRTIGIYPETKHPTYFARIGHPTDDRLVAELRRAGWDSADAPVFIQSFEVKNLQHLHGITKVRLIQLMAGEGGPADGAVPSYAAMLTPAGLRQVATYAYGLGPDKGQLWQGDAPTSLVADAHAVGLKVHPWTYRAENVFLPARFRHGDDPATHGDVAGEIRRALGLGIDGFFTDYPLIGVETRSAAKDHP